MRLKFFLRGLGAGIILGALVMLCSVLMSGSYRLSDKQIIERAEKLGMVYADSTTEKPKTETEAISSEKASTTEKTTAATTTEATTTEETSESSETSESTETTTEETTTEATTTEATTTEATTTEAATPEATTEKTTEATTEKADSKTKVKISVTPGMDSYSVAVLLADAGIVKDAAEFDNYLNANGYSTRIRVNEFEFKEGMSDKEIAEKLVSEGQ